MVSLPETGHLPALVSQMLERNVFFTSSVFSKYYALWAYTLGKKAVSNTSTSKEDAEEILVYINSIS
jgi:hypothetical protein